MKQIIPYGIQESQLQVISKHTELKSEDIISFLKFGSGSIFKILYSVCDLLDKEGPKKIALIKCSPNVKKYLVKYS